MKKIDLVRLIIYEFIEKYTLDKNSFKYFLIKYSGGLNLFRLAFYFILA